MDNPIATDPRRPEAVQLAPQWRPDVGSFTERVDHGADLSPLFRMGASDHARGCEAECYLARAADRFFLAGVSSKTFAYPTV